MIIKVIIVLSVLLNAALLISVTGIIPFLLYLSVFVNILLGWYVYNLLSHVNEFHHDLGEIFSSMTDLERHIGRVYELEVFYGDETLESLLKHLKSIADEISHYNEKYSFSEEEEIDAPEEEPEQ
jgi:hypothetical protein